MTSRTLYAAVLAFILSASASAEDACYKDAPSILSTLVTAQAQLIAGGRGNGTETFPDLVLYAFTHAVVAQNAERASSALKLQKLRGIQFAAATAQTSKQISSGADANGTTSLIEKPDFAKLLSFAV